MTTKRNSRGMRWIDSCLTTNNNSCSWMDDVNASSDDDYYDDDDSHTSFLRSEEGGDSYYGDNDSLDSFLDDNRESSRKLDGKKKGATQRPEAVMKRKMTTTTTTKSESVIVDRYAVTVITKNKTATPLADDASFDSDGGTIDRYTTVSDATNERDNYYVCGATKLCREILKKNKGKKNSSIRSSPSLMDTTLSSIAESDITSHEELDKLVYEAESTHSSSIYSDVVSVLRRRGRNKKEEDRSDMNSSSSSNTGTTNFVKAIRRVTFWDGYKKKEGEEDKSEKMYSSPVRHFKRSASWSDRIRSRKLFTQCGGTTECDGKPQDQTISPDKSNKILSEMKPHNGITSGIRRTLFEGDNDINTRRNKNDINTRKNEDGVGKFSNESLRASSFTEKCGDLNYRLTSTMKRIHSSPSPVRTLFQWDNNSKTRENRLLLDEFKQEGELRQIEPILKNNSDKFVFDENFIKFNEDDNIDHNSFVDRYSSFDVMLSKDGRGDDCKREGNNNTASCQNNNMNDSPTSIIHTSWYNRTEETECIMGGVRLAFEKKNLERAAKKTAIKKSVVIKEDGDGNILLIRR